MLAASSTEFPAIREGEGVSLQSIKEPVQKVLAVYRGRIASLEKQIQATSKWLGRNERLELAHRLCFYERAIERVEGNWRGQGETGVEFARVGHPYQEDLTILGVGSLFELLATTRSQVGAERLADYLLDTPSLEMARARQQAVRELRDQLGLREEIALLGKYRFQNCNGRNLREWLRQPIPRIVGWIPAAMAFFGGMAALLIVLGLAEVAGWSQLGPLLGFCVGVQAVFTLALSRRVRPQLDRLKGLALEFSVLRMGVSLVARQAFAAEILREQAQACRQGEAVKAIRHLERLVIALERREDLYLYGFSVALGAGTQLVLAIERWRAAHAARMEEWLDAWAEFEALNALASYAYEHPGDAFPDLLDGDAHFEAVGLCHPLLPQESVVGNTVALNGETAFYLISGSNMAGKSTLLRAMGLNAVLAGAGTTVRAASARMTVFHVCASISMVDSLLEGKSRFLAEIERVRDAVRATAGKQPVLFLLDEILSGTNSNDRRIAGEAVVQALLANGAVGALSTHDLALTEIPASLGGQNLHMQSRSSDRPLDFDYLLKPGIACQTNALAIVRMMGIGEETGGESEEQLPSWVRNWKAKA